MRAFSCLHLLLANLNIVVTVTGIIEGCGREDIRVISESDVLGITYFPSSCSRSPFSLISREPCVYWCSASVYPKYVSVSFREPLILEGMSTSGKTEGFVNDFVLSYSSTLEGTLTPYLRISLPSEQSFTFFFPSPIKAHIIRLTVATYVSLFNSFYYWHLELIGCSFNSSTLTSTAASNNEPNVVLPTNSIEVDNSRIDILATATEPTMAILSPSMDSCTDTTVSVKITVYTTQNITETVVMTAESSNLTSDPVVESDSRPIVENFTVPIVAAVMGSLVTMLVFGIVILAAFIIRKKCLCKRGRRGTLVEVSNTNLYEIESLSDNYTTKASNNSVYKKARLSVSTTAESKVLRSQYESPQAPLISDSRDHEDALYDQLSNYQPKHQS